MHLLIFTSFIWLILSTLTMSCGMLVGSRENSYRIVESNATAKEVFLFGVGGTRKPFNFIDADGQMIGFDIDVVKAVCAVAQMKCHTILTRKEDCIFTDRNIDYAGPGLMSEAISGCIGYQITTDRQNEFSFTLPYMTGKSTYAVLPGNPKHFDPNQDDFTKFRIVQIDGSAFNTACLRRLSKKFGKLLLATTITEAKEMLKNGTSDVLLSTRKTIDGLDISPTVVHCDGGHGVGVLLKKGNPVSQWWNAAFKKIYLSGTFCKMCKAAEKKYGESVNCLPPPDKADKQLLTLMKDIRNIPTKKKKSQRLWKFVVSGRIAPYSFLNQKGELVGFTKDFINSVCKIAGKECALLLAEVNECTVRIGELLYPGRGLQSGWFDACTGYFSTVDRRNSWDFTDPYLVSNASFYVSPGNPTGFNPNLKDLSSFTIVYQATAITNDHCLHRLHKKVGKLMVVEDKTLAIKAVLSGKADAWFTKMVFNESQSVFRLPERFHCENVGSSIMVRKGSELPNWWNKAFSQFVTTGQYAKFCKDQGEMYKTQFPCTPSPK